MKSTQALGNFDELPNSGFVRVDVVAGLFGCSRPTIWRLSRNGRLPKPRKLSERVTGWNVGELRRALGGNDHAK